MFAKKAKKKSWNIFGGANDQMKSAAIEAAPMLHYEEEDIGYDYSDSDPEDDDFGVATELCTLPNSHLTRGGKVVHKILKIFFSQLFGRGLKLKLAT